MSRDAASISLEADYAALLLEDLLEINDALPEIALACIPIQIALMAIAEEDDENERRALTDRASVVVTEIANNIERIQEPLLRMVRLMEGRVEVIKREGKEAN